MQENLGSRHGKKTDITTRTQILPLLRQQRAANPERQNPDGRVPSLHEDPKAAA
jgi:hypothetical protein